MLQIKPQNDEKKLKELYGAAGIPFSGNSVGIEAYDGENMIGYCLFSVEDRRMTILALTPANDLSLADGIVRSALYVGICRSVIDAYYTENKEIENLLLRLDLIEDKATKRINIGRLFNTCECCQSR